MEGRTSLRPRNDESASQVVHHRGLWHETGEKSLRPTMWRR